MKLLPDSSAQLFSRLKARLPERPVALAPADAFFTRKTDLPENLDWADKVAFIELALEGNAPFPMEQLAWGFLEDPDSPHVLVFATPRSRLRGLGIDPEQPFLQVFPGFISLFGDRFQAPTLRLLSQNGVLTALFYPARNPVPEKVVSRRIDGEILTDEALLKAREAFLKTLPADDYTIEEGLWMGEGITVLPGDTVRFKHRHISAGTPRPVRDHDLPLSGNALWAADLRDAAYASRERTVRLRSKTIWKSLQAAVATAILLLLLQFATLGLSIYNGYRENHIAELDPQATRVENKLTLAQRLTESTEEDLKPFVLMEAINPLRPDSVFFEDVRSRAFNQLEIEGQSSEGVTPVNAFADSIGQLPEVDSIVNNAQTRNNQTSFELIITFASIPAGPEGGFAIPEEPEEDSEESEATEENS